MAQHLVINGVNRNSFHGTLLTLAADASSLDMAVSYVLASGWELMEDVLTAGHIAHRDVRVLLTGQLNVTQPSALRAPMEGGVSFWRHQASNNYHPKVYIFRNRSGVPFAALIGSGNISRSGLQCGVEVGFVVTSESELRALQAWFESSLRDSSSALRLDAEQLATWESEWKLAKKVALTTARALHRKAGAASRGRRRPTSPLPPPPNEGAEVVEDILCTLSQPVAVLGMDHARNNVRNLAHLLRVLQTPLASVQGKQRSELRLLGLISDEGPTELGNRAARSADIRELAECWCRWVALQEESTLQAVNPAIASFQKAATRFWKMRPDVRRFFLANEKAPRAKRLLQCIELLCNTHDLACELSLEQIQELVPQIEGASDLGPSSARLIREYLGNKGARSWETGDRKMMLEVWRRISS